MGYAQYAGSVSPPSTEYLRGVEAALASFTGMVTNALESGMAADGSTNDGTILGDWLYTRPAGTTVILPAGRTILIATGLSLANAGVRIFGYGCTIKLSASAAANTSMMQFFADHQAVEGVTWDTNSISGATCCRPRANHGKFKNNRVINPMTGAVYIQDATTGVQVIGNTVVGNGWGVLFDQATTSKNVLIEGNTFDGTGSTIGDGVQVNTPTSASGAAADIVVSNNTILNYVSSNTNMGMGIGVAHASRVTVDGNTVTGCALDGYHFEDNATELTITGNTAKNCGRSGISFQPGAGSVPPSDATISGNTVVGCGTASGTGGIALEGAAGTKSVIISNNILRGNGRAAATTYYGIELGTGSTDVTVTDNQVYDTKGVTTAGIRAVNPSGLIVESNRCTDTQGSKTQDFGLSITGTLTNCKIGKTNSLAGNGTGTGWVTQGTCTVASGATTVVVTHGLPLTPNVADIFINRTNSGGTSTKFWVSATSSTTFTLTVDANPGATTATFTWEIITS